MAEPIAFRAFSRSVPFTPGPRQYGLVRRKDGREFVRNYKRPIRNGLTFEDLLARLGARARQAMDDMLARDLWPA